MKTINTSDVASRVLSELEQRRCANGEFSYAGERDGKESLPGIAMAIRILAVLGAMPADREARSRGAAKIRSYCDADGHFIAGEGAEQGPAYAFGIACKALTALGAAIPDGIAAPRAPDDPAELMAWLDRHDWNSTHKNLCRHIKTEQGDNREWTEVFCNTVASRLSPDRPLETWCAADAPPWKVISCIFHMLTLFDRLALPYAQPEMLFRRLLDLKWESVPDTVPRTICTDFDVLWLLIRFAELYFPASMETVVTSIRQISERRVREWNENPGQDLARRTTHEIWCFLISTDTFQFYARDHFTGGRLMPGRPVRELDIG